MVTVALVPGVLTSWLILVSFWPAVASPRLASRAIIAARATRATARARRNAVRPVGHAKGHALPLNHAPACIFAPSGAGRRRGLWSAHASSDPPPRPASPRTTRLVAIPTEGGCPAPRPPPPRQCRSAPHWGDAQVGHRVHPNRQLPGHI